MKLKISVIFLYLVGAILAVSTANAATIFKDDKLSLSLGAKYNQYLGAGSKVSDENKLLNGNYNIFNNAARYYIGADYKLNDETTVGFFGANNFQGEPGTKDSASAIVRYSYAYLDDTMFGKVTVGRFDSLSNNYLWNSIAEIYGDPYTGGNLDQAGFYGRLYNLINYTKSFQLDDDSSLVFSVENSPNPSVKKAPTIEQGIALGSGEKTGGTIVNNYYAASYNGVGFGYRSPMFNATLMYGQTRNVSANPDAVLATGSGMTEKSYATRYKPTSVIFVADAGNDMLKAYFAYAELYNINADGVESNFATLELVNTTKFDSGTAQFYGKVMLENGKYMKSYVTNVNPTKTTDSFVIQKSLVLGSSYTIQALKLYAEVLFDVRSESDIKKAAGENVAAYVYKSDKYKPVEPSLGVGFSYSF